MAEEKDIVELSYHRVTWALLGLWSRDSVPREWGEHKETEGDLSPRNCQGGANISSPTLKLGRSLGIEAVRGWRQCQLQGFSPYSLDSDFTARSLVQWAWDSFPGQAGRARVT